MAVALQFDASDGPFASRVDRELEWVRDRLVKSGKPISTTKEARRIVNKLRLEDPESLILWFEDQAVMTLAQRLQVSLAMTRNRAQSVFEQYDYDEEDEAFPFAAKAHLYHCADGQWRRWSELKRPDWRHVDEDRGARANANLVEQEFARLMALRLPDDETVSSKVVSVDEMQQLRAVAIEYVDRLLGRS
jgi:hypothetical protein